MHGLTNCRSGVFHPCGLHAGRVAGMPAAVRLDRPVTAVTVTGNAALSPLLHTAGDYNVAQEILINGRRTMRTRMRIDRTP
jgi:hypothetical protein